MEFMMKKIFCLFVVFFSAVFPLMTQQEVQPKPAIAQIDFSDLEKKIINYQSALNEINKKLEHLQSQKTSVMKKVEIAGLSPMVLTSLKYNLRNINRFSLDSMSLDQEVKILTELKILDLEEEINELQVGSEAWLSKRMELNKFQAYLNTILEINLKKESLSNQLEEFRTYIEERVLWTRSHSPIFNLKLNRIQGGETKSSNRWPEFHIRLVDLVWMVLLQALFLMLIKISIRKFQNLSTISFMLFVGIGAFLSSFIYMTLADYFTQIQSQESGADLFILTNGVAILIMSLCMQNGVIMRIYPDTGAIMKKFVLFSLMIMLTSPVYLLKSTLDHYTDIHNMADLINGWVFFLNWLFLFMICLFSVIYVVKHHHDFDRSYSFHQDRLHLVLLVITFSLPLILLVLSAMGYRDSSFYLYENWLYSVVIFLVWNYYLTLMWHFRRELRRESLENARELVESGGESDARVLRDANREVGKVFQFIGIIFLLLSFWHIWDDTFTAFKFSQNFELWKDGERVVTFLDVIFALVILYAGYVLHQNLRKSLDIYLFGPMGLSEGNRYAIATMLRYAILFIAALMAFRQIGLQWSEVQWLAAAFSVGLGFGMQEIFANFISGLIILTERPIRVGDVVSIGDDVWGQVENINIRSTTILNWDRQEVIVPNKDLISEKLINWTLSDKTIRVIIKVGVDYKTDVDQAKAIMLKAANDHPRVLNNPEPMAVLLNFGESSLDIEMDVFISEFKSEDDLDDIKDALNLEILRKFREDGIEIPFPQRVLHQASED